MLLRSTGLVCAIAGVTFAIVWDPTMCVVPAYGCASPLPGQTSSCVPPIPYCTSQQVPLRIGVAFLGVAIGIALFVLAWRRDRARAGA